MPILLGGVGEKVSNGGTQYYLQDRVFDSNGFSTAVTTAFMPYFLVDNLYENREPRVYQDYAPTIRAERYGLKIIEMNTQ